MKVFIATGCPTFKKAIQKYPFIAEDTLREDSDFEYYVREVEEKKAKVIQLDAKPKPKKRTFATIAAKPTPKKTHPERELVNVFRDFRRSHQYMLCLF